MQTREMKQAIWENFNNAYDRKNNQLKNEEDNERYNNKKINYEFYNKIEKQINLLDKIKNGDEPSIQEYYNEYSNDSLVLNKTLEQFQKECITYMSYDKLLKEELLEEIKDDVYNCNEKEKFQIYENFKKTKDLSYEISEDSLMYDFSQENHIKYNDELVHNSYEKVYLLNEIEKNINEPLKIIDLAEKYYNKFPNDELTTMKDKNEFVKNCMIYSITSNEINLQKSNIYKNENDTVERLINIAFTSSSKDLYDNINEYFNVHNTLYNQSREEIMVKFADMIEEDEKYVRPSEEKPIAQTFIDYLKNDLNEERKELCKEISELNHENTIKTGDIDKELYSKLKSLYIKYNAIPARYLDDSLYEKCYGQDENGLYKYNEREFINQICNDANEINRSNITDIIEDINENKEMSDEDKKECIELIKDAFKEDYYQNKYYSIIKEGNENLLNEIGKKFDNKINEKDINFDQLRTIQKIVQPNTTSNQFLSYSTEKATQYYYNNFKDELVGDLSEKQFEEICFLYKYAEQNRLPYVLERENSFIQNILTNYDNNFNANELKAQIDEYFKKYANLYEKNKTSIIVSIAEDINTNYGHDKAQEFVNILIDELNKEKDKLYQEMVYNHSSYISDYYDELMSYSEKEWSASRHQEDAEKLKEQASVLFQKYDIIPKEYGAIDNSINEEQFVYEMVHNANIEAEEENEDYNKSLNQQQTNTEEENQEL